MEEIFKATHFFGLILWMSGLISFSRILISYAESNALAENEGSIIRKHYGELLNRIYNLLCNPGMLLVLIGGIAMIANDMDYMKMGWMHIKLLLIIFLIGYQHMIKSAFKKLQKGDSKWTVAKLKKLSLAPIILMLCIIVLAVFRFI